MIAASVLANLVILDQSGVQIALATPVLAGALTFVGGSAYRVGIEQRQARALQAALASVIPPNVADEIGRHPDKCASAASAAPSACCSPT